MGFGVPIRCNNSITGVKIIKTRHKNTSILWKIRSKLNKNSLAPQFWTRWDPPRNDRIWSLQSTNYTISVFHSIKGNCIPGSESSGNILNPLRVLLKIQTEDKGENKQIHRITKSTHDIVNFIRFLFIFLLRLALFRQKMQKSPHVTSSHRIFSKTSANIYLINVMFVSNLFIYLLSSKCRLSLEISYNTLL